MADHNYHPPRIQNVLIGAIAFVVLIVLLWNLGDVVKRVGDVFLYIPAQLGLIRRVTPQEIIRMDSPAVVESFQPGRYMVFGNGWGPALSTASGEILISIQSQTSAEDVKIVRVQRGLRPYDTPFADGRPILEFEIPSAGQYEIIFKGHPDDLESAIEIVPDYTTGKESVLWIVYVVQIALLLILVGIVSYPYYQRRRARIQKIAAPQKKMQSRGQAFWDAQAQKEKEKNKEKTQK
jgi:hypothetical protein